MAMAAFCFSFFLVPFSVVLAFTLPIPCILYFDALSHQLHYYIL
jgi:hypothetical protein